jgi:hypothetical protein
MPYPMDFRIAVAGDYDLSGLLDQDRGDLRLQRGRGPSADPATA